MAKEREYIQFDWAMKYFLRDKANFKILEGLLSVLIGENVTIEEILESEGNQSNASDKFNRVDIKAKNSQGHMVIIEVQLTRQMHYMQRLLYGVSKTITDHMSLGSKYDKVKKVYSISILYCDLGRGEDYVYHGTTKFEGIHTHDELLVTTREKGVITEVSPTRVFPEYYIIRVNEFDKDPENYLDEWMDYLKTGRISDDTTAPGLQEAREKLQYLKMSESERRAYEDHLDTIMTQDDTVQTYYEDGREDGLKEGMQKERIAIACKMIAGGLDAASICQMTGLSPEELLALKR